MQVSMLWNYKYTIFLLLRKVVFGTLFIVNSISSYFGSEDPTSPQKGKQ